jgi:hypothetical protein
MWALKEAERCSTGNSDERSFQKSLEIFGLDRPVRCATERLSCNSATICSSPNRRRQRVSDERSNGRSCGTSPRRRNTENTGCRPTCRTAPRQRDREIVHVLEDERSGYQPCRQRWLPRPGATDQTESVSPGIQSISAARRTSGWRRLMIFSRISNSCLCSKVHWKSLVRSQKAPANMSG